MSKQREILDKLEAETLRDMIVDLWAAIERRDTDLEFAYKRVKVLADLLGIPVHESLEVTGTILGLARGNVERLIAERDLFKKETGALASDSVRYQSALNQIASSIPASRQNTPVSYLQGIAKAALEI